MPKVRGDGSVVQLDKSVSRSKCRLWRLEVSTGRDLGSGCYKKITRRFHGTITKAKKALRDLIDEIERDKSQRRSDMRFGEYCDAWLSDRVNKVSFGTAKKDGYRLKCFRMFLEDAKLSDITPEVLETIYQRAIDGESPSGKKLSPNTVAGNATTLHRMFHDAIKAGHMTSNPCDYAERPRMDVRERNSIRAEAIVELIEKLDRCDPSQLVLVIALKTGMRRGEIHGLSWNDIDFENMEIHVHHSFDDWGHLKEPKTSNGYRDIPMTDSLKADLLKRLEYQKTMAVKHGIEIDDDTPVICNDAFERELPHSSTRWWSRNREALGFPNLTIHEMRHSFLSEMARRKVDPKVLQKLAGHAKYSTTMDIYTHVDMEDKREAMKKMDW